MKLKFLLPVVLFFYCFNTFAQDNFKSPKGNNDNSNSVMKGCEVMDVSLDFNAIPSADSVVVIGPYMPATVYISGNDSVVLFAHWDYIECGPLEEVKWFMNGSMIDSIYVTNSTQLSKTVAQSGDYYALITRYISGYIQMPTRHVTIISTNSATSIDNHTNPDLNVSIIKNKIIVKDLLKKDNLTLSVYDLTGRSIFNKEIISPASFFEIEIPSLSNGLYVLNMRSKDFNILKKFNSGSF